MTVIPAHAGTHRRRDEGKGADAGAERWEDGRPQLLQCTAAVSGGGDCHSWQKSPTI